MKAQTAYKRTKIKNAHEKHLRKKKSLIRLFAFHASAWLCLCAFCVFVHVKFVCKKKV